MYWITILEALAVVLFIVGLLNEKKLIGWEERMMERLKKKK